MKKQRWPAALQAFILCSAMLCGCTAAQAPGTSTSTPASSTEPVSTASPASGDGTAVSNVNEFGWEAPTQTLAFTVYNVAGNDAPTEEEKAGRENMKNYLKEKFNVDMTVQMVDGDGTEALNLALAADNYPDVINNASYAMALKFKEQGKAVELTPYMDTIGKDIKAAAKDTYPLLLDDEGKLWFLPTEMGALMELPDYSASIRYDEWTAIGSPEIETPDDYYNALKAVIGKNPTTPTGESRYALSLYNTQDYPNEFGGYWGLRRGWKISDDNSFTYWAFTDEGKSMTKWFNTIYRDGLFDPDAFASKFDDWKAKFSTERIAGSIGGWWICYNAGHEVWQTLDPNIPEEKRYIQVGFKAPEAKEATVTGKNKYGSSSTIVTNKAKDVEGILKFINFQATEKGMALFGWGIPNGTPTFADPNKTIKEWTLNSDGSWEFDPEAKEAFITEKWDYNAEAVLGTGGSGNLFRSVDRWPDGEFCVWPNQCWYSENKWKTIMLDNLKGTIYDATPMILRDMDADTTLIEQSVKDAWKQYWPACVQSADDAAFDQNWAALQSALTSANIEAYTKAVEENYKRNMEKLGK